MSTNIILFIIGGSTNSLDRIQIPLYEDLFMLLDIHKFTIKLIDPTHTTELENIIFDNSNYRDLVEIYPISFEEYIQTYSINSNYILLDFTGTYTPSDIKNKYKLHSFKFNSVLLPLGCQCSSINYIELLAPYIKHKQIYINETEILSHISNICDKINNHSKTDLLIEFLSTNYLENHLTLEYNTELLDYINEIISSNTFSTASLLTQIKYIQNYYNNNDNSSYKQHTFYLKIFYLLLNKILKIYFQLLVD